VIASDAQPIVSLKGINIRYGKRPSTRTPGTKRIVALGPRAA